MREGRDEEGRGELEREQAMHQMVKNKGPNTDPPSKDEIGSDKADDQEGPS